MGSDSGSKPKIVFLDSRTLNPGDVDVSELEKLGVLTFYESTSQNLVVERCQDAQIIISNKVKLTKEIIDALPQLKMIQIAATGMNNVDVEFAKSKGIHVCNVVGYSTSSVAQHVFAMILAHLNQCESYFAESNNKEWSKKSDFSYWHKPIDELQDKTFGVWGFGNIGQAVARIAVAFGMKVIAVNKYPERLSIDDVENVSVQELLESADFISLHTPLNDQTFEMINGESISIMKKTAVIINTGRGQLINEMALAQALDEGIISAALLDVLSMEPPAEDHVLLSTQNAFITPHQAWASLPARRRLLKGIVENISSFLIR